MTDIADRLTTTINQVEPLILALSRDIHAHPELAFQELHASAAVAELLESAGFNVERGVGDLSTALRADFGSGELVVGVVAEYDALPQIGHACGHNIIAAAAVGAALALAEVADDLGVTVRLFGAPAEEDGGGKVLMLDRGVFAGTHLAMMVHPFPLDLVECNVLAISDLTVTYRGHPAHASFAPYEGVNAADALTIAQVALGLLRQQLPPGDQIHGIITHGGDAPNVIPERTTAYYCIRSSTVESLQVLRQRVVKCFDAGALATGCHVDYSSGSPDYTEFHNDPVLCAVYRGHAADLGRTPDDADGEAPSLGSTDMANVSRVIPAIHPMIAVDAGGASNHQSEFADACVGPPADRAIRDAALLMARTAATVAQNPDHRARYLNRAHDGDSATPQPAGGETDPNATDETDTNEGDR